MKLSGILIIALMCSYFSCNDKDAEKIPGEGDDVAIIFTIDSHTRMINAKEREADEINLEEYPIKTLFRKKGGNNSFEVNLNFYEKDILDKIPVTYSLPEDNLKNVKIDLNFIDFGREVEKTLHSRLLFDQGSIIIHQLDSDGIHFEFEGEVHELMNDPKRSVVSGRVNVQY